MPLGATCIRDLRRLAHSAELPLETMLRPRDWSFRGGGGVCRAAGATFLRPLAREATSATAFEKVHLFSLVSPCAITRHAI